MKVSAGPLCLQEPGAAVRSVVCRADSPPEPHPELPAPLGLPRACPHAALHFSCSSNKDPSPAGLGVTLPQGDLTVTRLCLHRAHFQIRPRSWVLTFNPQEVGRDESRQKPSRPGPATSVRAGSFPTSSPGLRSGRLCGQQREALCSHTLLFQHAETYVLKRRHFLGKAIRVHYFSGTPFRCTSVPNLPPFIFSRCRGNKYDPFTTICALPLKWTVDLNYIETFLSVSLSGIPSYLTHYPFYRSFSKSYCTETHSTLVPCTFSTLPCYW